MIVSFVVRSVYLDTRKTQTLVSFSGLHAQLLSLTVQKAGRRPGRTYHVMCATAEVMYCS